MSRRAVQRMSSVQWVKYGACRLFSDLTTGDILRVILLGHETELERLLSNGLAPNATYSFRYLLDFAITTRQVGIAAMLLLYGADPNLQHLLNNNQVAVTKFACFKHYFNESLVKLLLTYYTNFSYLVKTSAHPRFLALWDQRETYYRLYHAEQAGDNAFNKHNYSVASEQYSHAATWLRQLLEEEIKKTITEPDHEIVYEQQTSPWIATCYRERLAWCEDRLSICQTHLNTQMAQHADKTRERDSLIPTPSSDAKTNTKSTLRKRLGF